MDSIVNLTIRGFIAIILFFLLLFSLWGCGGGGGGGGPQIPPAAPAGVRALAGDTVIVVGWNAVSGARSYNLYLASTSGVSKSIYEMKLAGVKRPYTVTGLTNGNPYYFVVTAVNSAGESGESAEVSGTPVTGVGDTGNYFPFAAGNTWTLSGRCWSLGSSISYSNVITTGTAVFNGASATVFALSNSFNSGTPVEEYLLKDRNGIIYLGNNDAADALTSQMTPYWLVQFPLQTGASFVQMDKTGLDSGEDIDGDGIRDRVDVYSIRYLSLAQRKLYRCRPAPS